MKFWWDNRQNINKLNIRQSYVTKAFQQYMTNIFLNRIKRVCRRLFDEEKKKVSSRSVRKAKKFLFIRKIINLFLLYKFLLIHRSSIWNLSFLFCFIWKAYLLFLELKSKSQRCFYVTSLSNDCVKRRCL